MGEFKHFTRAELAGEAGVDPWQIDRSLQAGDPGRIDAIADGIHRAGTVAGEVDSDFGRAREQFRDAWVSDGSRSPIEESVEVRRITASVGAHREQLRAIATAYELIAAALAKAQRDADSEVAALEKQLHAVDEQMDAADRLMATDPTMAQNVLKVAKGLAVEFVQNAGGEIQGYRTTYTGVLAEASKTLKDNGAPPSPDVPAETRPEVLKALDGQLPSDPKEFAQLWAELTPAERDLLYSKNNAIGNSNGMPAVDRDHYNRETLATELSAAQAAQARLDALRAQHPDWANGAVPMTRFPGMDKQYQAWKRQWDDAQNGAKYLPDLKAVSDTVGVSPDRKLMVLDTHTGKQARAAVAVGDPDTATHVSVSAPGLNSNVHGGLKDMVGEATSLRDVALRQLQSTPGHEHDSVSAIAWMGYDPPQVPGWDQLGASAAGLWGVSHDDIAKAGAHDLAGFYDGIQAAHHGGPTDLTAIGHSYGSLTTGLALQEPGDHGVSRALFYGSPGIEATTPQQLHLQPGHVFTMETPDDPIQQVYDAPPIAHALAPFLPFGLNSVAEGALAVGDLTGAGHFGPNPATNPNFTHLATGAATVPDGRGGFLNLAEAHGHSDYPRTTDGGGLRTTNYNIAAVVAGLKPVEQN
ncbi:MAG: alpha/beta hydrolase [Mycobacterium sp.]